MSEGGSYGKRVRCPACTAADRRKHTDDELKQFHPERWEFEEATRELKFTKDFNPALEAIMHDPLASIGERVLAWIKRQAWGNFHLDCVKDNGEPAFQVDCAAGLGVDKRRVCGAMKHLVARGYVEMRGTAKQLFPVIRPRSDGPPPDPGEKSGEYRTFLENWKVAHSTDFSELEVARSTVARIRKVLLSDYKLWRALQTKSGAIKGRDSESSESNPPGGRTSPVLVTGKCAPAREARPPADAIPDESLKTKLRTHLLSLSIPGKLQDADFEAIALAIADEKTFKLFCANTEGRAFRKWILVRKMAEESRERAATYPDEQAQAAGASARLPEWAKGLEHERRQKGR